MPNIAKYLQTKLKFAVIREIKTKAFIARVWKKHADIADEARDN